MTDGHSGRDRERVMIGVTAWDFAGSPIGGNCDRVVPRFCSQFFEIAIAFLSD